MDRQMMDGRVDGWKNKKQMGCDEEERLWLLNAQGVTAAAAASSSPTIRRLLMQMI